jgi:hypothetical protein
MAKAKYTDVLHKNCECCGVELHRREKEPWIKWSTRSFCSKSCATKTRMTTDKVCARCGRKFSKKKGISAPEWHVAKYCSTACLLADDEEDAMCECGKESTSVLYFMQIDVNNNPIMGELHLCQDCYNEMLQYDTSVRTEQWPNEVA